jgi:hypothetical protein
MSFFTAGTSSLSIKELEVPLLLQTAFKASDKHGKIRSRQIEDLRILCPSFITLEIIALETRWLNPFLVDLA